jgi:integrase
LTDEEAASLLACCGAHLTPLVMTALHTGFWASELLSLTWQDADFRRGVIMVQAGYA